MQNAFCVSMILYMYSLQCIQSTHLVNQTPYTTHNCYTVFASYISYCYTRQTVTGAHPTHIWAVLNFQAKIVCMCCSYFPSPYSTLHFKNEICESLIKRLPGALRGVSICSGRGGEIFWERNNPISQKSNRMYVTIMCKLKQMENE